MSAPGGVCSGGLSVGGCLLWAMSAPGGVCSKGVSATGRGICSEGVCSQGGHPSMH